MKQLIIQDKDDYANNTLKDKSVSIEMKMIVDDGSKVSPFIKMFKLDDFRELNYKDIESIILNNSNHIARTFALALLNRQDCLNGEMTRDDKPATGAEQ